MEKKRRRLSRSRNFPELQKGIRIQYQDLNEATRAGRISARKGNFLTIKNALNEKKRIRITQIKGWWPPRVKCSPRNMISLTDKEQKP